MTDFPSLFPHHDFKVADPDNPEDYGLRMRMMETRPGAWYLHQRSRGGYLSVYDYPFPTAEAGVAWAQTMYLGNGATVFERKDEDYDLPEPKMKRSELEELMANFKAQGGVITQCRKGAKTQKPKAEQEDQPAKPAKEPKPAAPAVTPTFKSLF